MTQILTAVVGSRLHGNAREDSDTDLHGIHVDRTMDLVGVGPVPHPVKVDQSKPDVDFTSWEIGHWANMALQGELNCLEVLWAEEYPTLTTKGSELIAIRDSFLSQRIRPKWIGWCNGMAKRVGKGQGRARTELGRTKEAFHCLRILDMLRLAWKDGIVQPHPPHAQALWRAAETLIHNDGLDNDGWAGRQLQGDIELTIQFTKDHESALPEEPPLYVIQDYMTEVRLIHFRGSTNIPF
ncbi:nucleotidyltransferase [Gordonia phage Yvonnetastic]|uniref:Nucleotidyltransferase n=1 Tax=Gordonia phage Yvonnetastic TaxID=1821566 RepID=A0A142K9A8_9CAUD|nr:nucleotidyltransferase [Gordonia phage Yvonnetastic]AMS02691.1 nucleotidyltransferase [Gordonia phage Yvonnetastic]